MRLFLATTPTEECLESLRLAKPTSVLISYYYLKQRPIDFQERFLKTCKDFGAMIFVDSGAFTFIFAKNSPITRMKSLQERYDFFEKYSKGYIEFLKQWWKYIDYFAEIDVDVVIGYPNVMKLRDLFLPSLKEKFCPVHHQETRPFSAWERDVADFDFLAIGSSSIRTDSILYFKDLIKYSHKYKKKVHGFALVNHKILTALPFYSADSSSWIQAANSFGNLTIFDQETHKLKYFHYRDPKMVKKYYAQIVKYCPDFRNIYENKSVTPTASRIMRGLINACAYKELEAYLTSVWERRGVKWSS